MATIEYIAAACGLLGTVLLATKGKWAGWGFVAFLGSNIGWLVFSYGQALWPLFWQTIGFTISSLFGIWRWLIEPLADAALAHALDKRFEGNRSSIWGGK